MLPSLCILATLLVRHYAGVQFSSQFFSLSRGNPLHHVSHSYSSWSSEFSCVLLSDICRPYKSSVFSYFRVFFVIFLFSDIFLPVFFVNDFRLFEWAQPGFCTPSRVILDLVFKYECVLFRSVFFCSIFFEVFYIRKYQITTRSRKMMEFNSF